MVYRNFKDGDKDHSLLGFGIMRMPTKKDGESEVIDYELSEAMIDEAYKNGVNYFDTAYVYHDGHSERFLGNALKKYPRDSYFIATKLPLWSVETVEKCDEIFQEHLDRLQTDYIDYYLFHAMEKNKVEKVKNLKLLDWVDKKKAEGKIKHMCFSFHGDAECLEELLTMYKFDFCQLQINYADWNKFNAKKFYDIATKHNTPVVVMEPVRGGALANPVPEVADIFAKADPSRSFASWAFRFVADLPNVALILSGMSTMDQVQDNLKTFASDSTVDLSSHDKDTLHLAMDILENHKSIPCTACQYCMPCPVGVDIPTCFLKFNTAKVFGRASYKAIPEDKRANNCISCGKCLQMCPQQINIPEK
ncbi:hypothetical protein AN643_01005, partial [Candidatus Epulonipiscioides saccharophilum]